MRSHRILIYNSNNITYYYIDGYGAHIMGGFRRAEKERKIDFFYRSTV